MEELSPSKQMAAKNLYEAFKIIKENGGELTYGEVIKRLEERLEFSDYEKHTFETTGNARWKANLSWYSVDAVKIGFIRKLNGKWVLTNEGEDALKLDKKTFIETIISKYNQLTKKTSKIEIIDEDEVEIKSEEIQKITLEQLESDARNSIKEYLYSKNPYEFQDLVAALLEGMGYFISFIATRGKDGGLDIIAYQDQLGIKLPKIKVQVKHYTSATVQVSEVRSLIGLLDKENDVGLFVTSGKFSSDSLRFARESHIHIELIDFDKFVDLWIEHYNKLTDEQKNMMPIKAINFLGINE